MVKIVLQEALISNFKNMESEKNKFIINNHLFAIEILTSLIAVTFLVYLLRSMLLYGETTLTHDNLTWNYPIFQFFAENMINGHFPLWNPFDHGGEPFYPILTQTRLLEPITLLTIYLGQFITNDIVMLFNWNRFIQSLVMIFGVYIVFRPWAKHLFVRLSLIPILLYSSFMLVSFRSDGIWNQFLWIPFITYFLLRIFYYRNYRWHNWLLLVVLIGISWQSYFFTGTWIFILFFSLGGILFRRDLLTGLLRSKMLIPKLTVMAVIISAMAIPNIILMLEMDKYVFPARMVDFPYEGQIPEGGPLQYEVGSSSVTVSGINMPYDFIVFSGTFSSIWDFIQIIAPDGNHFIGWRGRHSWGGPSEAYMYLGFLPWAIAVLGLVVGKHDMKRLWLIVLAGLGLLMLGPPGGLHRVLYYIYPPIWFVRHTHTLVLPFIFAFLYFYILGFNHIFFTWQGVIFQHYKSQGILSRYIKDDKVCKVAAFFIFSACIVVSVYLMGRVKYPATNYLFGFIALIVAIGWFLRKDLGEKGLYIGLIVSHIAIVLIFSRNTFTFVEYIVPVLGLPIALFLLIKSRKELFRSLQYYSALVLLCLFSISLMGDLAYSFIKSSFLYRSEKHPGITLGIKTIPQVPFLPQNRSVIIDPPPNYRTNSDQGIRYLPLIFHQPVVFSSAQKEIDYFGPYVFLKSVFNGLANNSFESWIVNSGFNLLPKEFDEYCQDGDGGGIYMYSGYEGVKDGKTSVLLRQSSVGNSLLRHKFSRIDELRGQHVRLSVWVKSQNKSRNAIQVDMQDDRGNIVIKSYNNSGEWEHIRMGMYINKDATKLFITLNIKSRATSPAYFDMLTIETVDVRTNTIEYALGSKRWSSFLLPRKYFELINMDISALVLGEMFAVDEPMFQFKQAIVQVKESEIPIFLKQIGPAKSVELLKEAVIIVDEQIASSLPKLSMPAGEVKKEKQFMYSIEKYYYDSFEMKVYTDTEGILYWADGYDKNWRSYVNGKEVPIYRANINFKAISLPKGSNNVTFIYDPYLFKRGLFIFCGTAIICFSIALVSIIYHTIQRRINHFGI